MIRGFSLLILCVIVVSCSAEFGGGGGSFSGDTARTSGETDTQGGPFGADAGDGVDLGGGNDGGDGIDSDGGESGGTGGLDSDGGSDSGDDADGDDEGGDDDIDGSDDGSNSTKLRLPLTIRTDKDQHDVTLRIQWFTDKKEGDWTSVEAPKKGSTITVEDICSKKGDTEIRVEFSGGKVQGARAPHKNLKRIGGLDSNVQVGFESSATCGIFDSGILASDCHDDNKYDFSCPKNGLEIENL